MNTALAKGPCERALRKPKAPPTCSVLRPVPCQLGALTKGDRRGCCDGFDVSKFSDVTGKWGDYGVEEMCNAFVQERPPNGASAALRATVLADGGHSSFVDFASAAHQQLINAGFYGSEKKNRRARHVPARTLQLSNSPTRDALALSCRSRSAEP